MNRQFLGTSHGLMKALKIALTLCLVWAFSACDHGLEVPSVKPGFGGRINYKGKWPPPDSIMILAVVAFKNFPPTNIFADVVSGEALFDTSLSKRKVEFQDYWIYPDPAILPVTFRYIVVAQQYGTDLLSNWRVIGVYSDDPERIVPKPVVVVKDSVVLNVNIEVDFDHLPPQVLGKRSSQ